MTNIFRVLLAFSQLAINPKLKIWSFLWVCWFLGTNLSNFVSPVWKFHNPYCHIERDAVTGLPKTSDKKTTDEICKVVHESPGFIPIRDKYVKVALQTNDSNLGK